MPSTTTAVSDPWVPSSSVAGLGAGRSRPPRPPSVSWSQPHQSPGPGTGYTLLCIDDELVILKYLEELFALNGFDVDVAVDGTTGLALAMTGLYDALVVDLLLPDLPGLDLVRAVRGAGRSRATVLLTGCPTIPSAIEATQLGVPYLIKGECKGTALVDSVLDAIAGSVSSRPLFRRTAGRSHAVMDVVRIISDVRPRCGTNATAVRHDLRHRLGHLLAWFDLSFLEFVAAAEGFRRLNNDDYDLETVLAGAALRLDEAARRAWPSVDCRLRGVVDQLEDAGDNWQAVSELAASRTAGLLPAPFRELLSREFRLSWPRTRWSLTMRRVILELAAHDEQVAQIAYRVGFAHPSALNDTFAGFLGTSPTAYRRLMERSSSASEQKPKE